MPITSDLQRERDRMVKTQLEPRGIRDPGVLRAMREVPREKFLPEELEEFAYADVALPIAEGQTISQPFVVALMADMAGIEPGDRVLEIGTGSGYSAGVLSCIASEVHTVERHQSLAEVARSRLGELGYDNVHVVVGDGTLGWPEAAPYDAIIVTASGPQVPEPLLQQLKVGGRLVIPVGEQKGDQSLRLITRTGERSYAEDDLGPVRFVPLIGKEGWRADGDSGARSATVSGAQGSRNRASVLARPETLSRLVAEAAEPFPGIEEANLDPLLERIGDSRVVLIGEATHGTSEFYRMRARITRELIERKGFNLVTAEADWPDAARVDRYVRHVERPARVASIFARFPLWMWKNLEVLEFVEWLRERNSHRPYEERAGFFGLDLYSLYTSIEEVLHYLEGVDTEVAHLARLRYGCLTPFESDPALYGHAALTGRYQTCEGEVVRMLTDLLKKRTAYAQEDGEEFFEATRNALVVANAEKYYRAMYYGSAESWNLRDRHMFDTLEALLEFYGPQSKAVVWAHNSHCGDSSATEMSARGEINIGQLSRERFGEGAYIIGFGTDRGTVAAASNWGGPVEIKQVRPSYQSSYEQICHRSEVPAFVLHLREPERAEVREELEEPRLERAIGVIYRPDTELMSHYFQASLPYQFDEYIWFDESQAVTPLGPSHAPSLPQAHPFALVDE